MVRTISDSPTSDRTAMRCGSGARLAQMVMERFGSQSRMTISAPAWASSVARMTEAVDFPAPPFGEATVTTGIYAIRFDFAPDISVYPVKRNIGLKLERIFIGYEQLP